MEKAEKIVMVPAGFGWSDVGSWDAVAGAHETDEEGNSAVGTIKSILVETRNTHVESTSHTEKVIAAIGLQNVVIIDTPDALLVADRAKSQDVKLVVEALNGYADASLRNCLPPYSGHGAHMLRFVEETTIRSNASPSSQVRSSAFNSTISAPNTGC